MYNNNENMNIITLPTALGKSMKPIQVWKGSEDEDQSIRRRQEDIVLGTLQDSDISMRASDLLDAMGESFPMTARQWRSVEHGWGRNSHIGPITRTLQRLESTGYVVSTLYKGHRYYSILQENGGVN